MLLTLQPLPLSIGFLISLYACCIPFLPWAVLRPPLLWPSRVPSSLLHSVWLWFFRRGAVLLSVSSHLWNSYFYYLSLLIFCFTGEELKVFSMAWKNFSLKINFWLACFHCPGGGCLVWGRFYAPGVVLLDFRQSKWSWDFRFISKILNQCQDWSHPVWILLWMLLVLPLRSCPWIPIECLLLRLASLTIILSWSLRKLNPQHLSWSLLLLHLLQNLIFHTHPFLPAPFWS